MADPFVPQRGDVVWLTDTPQTGRGQAGRCPAVVLSPGTYNGKVGLALVCPITSRVKGYPFEVNLPDSLPVQGAVLCDQVRSLDWRARNAERIGTLPEPIWNAILSKTRALL